MKRFARIIISILLLNLMAGSAWAGPYFVITRCQPGSDCCSRSGYQAGVMEKSGNRCGGSAMAGHEKNPPCCHAQPPKSDNFHIISATSTPIRFPISDQIRLDSQFLSNQNLDVECILPFWEELPRLQSVPLYIQIVTILC